MITATEMDAGLDAGLYACGQYSPNFQRDIAGGRQPDIQVNVDATRMSGRVYRQQLYPNIISGEVSSFVARAREITFSRWSLEIRMRFSKSGPGVVWRRDGDYQQHYHALAIVLTGSALIAARARHGRASVSDAGRARTEP